MDGMTDSRLLSASVRIASLVMPIDSSVKVTSCDFDFLSAFLQLHRRQQLPSSPHLTKSVCEKRWRPKVGHLAHTQVLTVPVFTICLVPGKREYWRQHSAFLESETDTVSAGGTDDATL